MEIALDQIAEKDIQFRKIETSTKFRNLAGIEVVISQLDVDGSQVMFSRVNEGIHFQLRPVKNIFLFFNLGHADARGLDFLEENVLARWVFGRWIYAVNPAANGQCETMVFKMKHHRHFCGVSLRTRLLNHLMHANRLHRPPHARKTGFQVSGTADELDQLAHRYFQVPLQTLKSPPAANFGLPGAPVLRARINSRRCETVKRFGIQVKDRAINCKVIPLRSTDLMGRFQPAAI